MDYAVRGEKSLLAYPCMIIQLCLVAGVLYLPRIDDMIEAIKTKDLGLITDVFNSLS